MESVADDQTPATDTHTRSDRVARETGSGRRILDVLTSRWVVKTAFFAFFVYACVQLFRFAAWAKGTGPYVHRPEAPAGLLPVGHFTSFFAWVRGGGWDSYLPAGLVIIVAAIAVSFAFRRGFCGWICPVGTVWEAFASLGRRLFGKNFVLPRWADLTGRIVRFVLAGIVVLMLMSVSIAEAVDFRTLPYMWTADLKILGLMIQPVYLLVVLVVGAATAFIGPLWCRYLCPVGGMYCGVAALSPTAIVRDEDACISCQKCAKSCHAYCRPDKARTLRDTECDGCMDCVKVCPVDGCLEAKAFGRVRIAPWLWPLLVVALWLGIYGAAKLTGSWDSSIKPEQFRAVIQSGILEQSSMPRQ